MLEERTSADFFHQKKLNISNMYRKDYHLIWALITQPLKNWL